MSQTALDPSAASFAALLHKLDYLDESDVRRVREAYRFADDGAATKLDIANLDAVLQGKG